MFSVKDELFFFFICTEPVFATLTHQHSLHRYQPAAINPSSQMEKLVELVEGEKVAVSGGDSGDEFGEETEVRPLQEAFTVKKLFCPSSKIPTTISGNIVYGTTAVICEHLPVDRVEAVGLKFSPTAGSNLPFVPPAAVFVVLLCIVLANWLPELLAGHAGVAVACVVLALLCGVCVVIIWRQPESKEALTFKVLARGGISTGLRLH